MKRTELALLLKGLAIIAGGMAFVLCGPVVSFYRRKNCTAEP